VDPWTDAITRILDQAPTRARPLSLILRELDAAGMPVEGRREWVLRRISELPARFIVIPAHRIPWVPWPRTAPSLFRCCPSVEMERDPWVMSRTRGLGRVGPGGRTMLRIQEGLHALAEAVDEGSQGSVARWVRANQEGERACRVLFTGHIGTA
jgi:hypothetical protein